MTTPSDNAPEIVTTRIFNAPRERVYQAFADPAQLQHWWGPEGFTNTIQEFDLRPGGAWHLVMHAPDGAAYDNASEFLEIVPLEKIRFLHLGPGHRYHMTMTFIPHDEKTALTWRMASEAHANEKMASFIAAANEQNFDRLVAWLEK